MTAKEKAIELVEKFKPYSSTTNRPDEPSQGFCATVNAKKSAVILCSQVIKEIRFLTDKFELNGNQIEQYYALNDYWNNVITEIQRI